MNILETFRFTIGGFSANRVSYMLSGLSFTLLPVHFNVPCEVSVLTAGVAILLFLATAALCFFVPRGTSHRFRPLGFAFLGVVMHILCSH